MTLKQLVYFLKIAETGNLTRAALELNMSQPPLSYQLKMLEDEMGVTLFTRESHSLKITDEGIYLSNKATQILSLVDKTASEIKTLNANQKFIINIGTVTSSGHNFLPKTIRTFKELHPLSSFNIYNGSSMRLQELLHNSIIDIAILREPFPKDEYESMMLPSSNLNSEYDNDYFVAVGSKRFLKPVRSSDNHINFSDVIEMPLVVHRRFEEQLHTQAKTITSEVRNIICRNDNISSSIEWASGELGVAIMPYTSSLLITDKKLIVRKIVNPSFYSNMYIVWKNNADFDKHTRAFLEMCKEYLEETP